MDDQTIFYIVGGALAVLAVLISFLGIRDKEFPRPGAIGRITVAIFAVLVVVTAAYAILSAREEQAERREHLAAAAEHAAEEEPTVGEVAEQPFSEEPAKTPPEEPPAGGDEGGDELETLGADVFAGNGCGGCHALSAAEATGAVGPDLDVTLVNQEAAAIEESIVDPDATVVDGYEPGVMPATFGEKLSPEEIKALVAYLQFAVSQS